MRWWRRWWRRAKHRLLGRHRPHAGLHTLRVPRRAAMVQQMWKGLCRGLPIVLGEGCMPQAHGCSHARPPPHTTVCMPLGMHTALDATSLACLAGQCCHAPTPRSPRIDTAPSSFPPGLARDSPRCSRLGCVDGEDPAHACRAAERCNGGVRGLAVRHGHGAIAPYGAKSCRRACAVVLGARCLTVMGMHGSSGETIIHRMAIRGTGG